MAKPTVTGDCQGNDVLKSLLTQLSAYGLIADSTVLGEPPDDEDATLEAERCRVANGAIEFLIYQIYNYFIEATYANPIGNNSIVSGIPDYIEAATGSFQSWITRIREEYDFLTFEPENHRNAVFAQVETIKQLYYCALSPGGVLGLDGYEQFQDAILTQTSLSAVDAEILHLFTSDFNLASYALLNADGYFYVVENPCTLTDDCVPAGEWGKAFEFSIDDFEATFDVTNGVYQSGAWYQDSLTSPLLLRIDAYVTKANFSYEANTGDAQTAQIVDNASGAVLASASHFGGGYSLVWEASSEAEHAAEGVTFRYDSDDLFGTVGTNGRIKGTCVLGRGAAPAEGSDTLTCG
jgi:hypothetical protein